MIRYSTASNRRTALRTRTFAGTGTHSGRKNWKLVRTRSRDSTATLTAWPTSDLASRDTSASNSVLHTISRVRPMSSSWRSRVSPSCQESNRRCVNATMVSA